MEQKQINLEMKHVRIDMGANIFSCFWSCTRSFDMA